ncbi:7575_t:CDS:2, partial [Entrophospora sp. SA101]
PILSTFKNFMPFGSIGATTATINNNNTDNNNYTTTLTSTMSTIASTTPPITTTQITPLTSTTPITEPTNPLPITPNITSFDDDQNYKDIKATFDRINSDWLEEQRHSGGFGDNNNNSDLFPFPRLSSSPSLRNNRSMTPLTPTDPNGILEKKFNTLNKKWESLKNEMTSIREELKEDKWSGLFKQVAGNANQMMDSLERSVKQCKDFMYRAINRSDSPRYPQRNNNQRSYSSDSLHHLQQQNNIQPQVAINPKNYQRLYKNFDAKRKYYVPAVTKLLTMLANGINNQMTQDPESIDKYNAMKERWDNILDGVADVQRDMPTLEYMLDASLTSSTSPPSSIPSSIASSPPISPNMRPTVRSSRFSPELLPNSPSRNYRSVSPYRTVISPSEYDRSLSPPTTSPSIATMILVWPCAFIGWRDIQKYLEYIVTPYF